VLIFAYNASAPLHIKASGWWEREVNRRARLGISWPVFQAFLRLLTNPKIVEEPYTAAEIFAVAEGWWSRPNIELLEPTRETYKHFRHLMERYGLAGGISTDALIGAYAIEHGARVVTNDTDFLRFEEVRVLNPFTKPEIAEKPIEPTQGALN
jgi:toxin-antitoxin system PIN domain toxin